MQPDRRTTVRLLLLALISSTCFLSSCTDGDWGLSGSSRFSFTATVSDTTGLATRSGRGSGLPKDTVTAVEGYDAPLYLHTIYEDGIASEGVDNVSDRADKDAHTRAAAVTGMYDSFAVSAYSYKGTWNESLTPNWFHGVKATLSDGSYALASTYYWPGSAYKMKFFAYAPTDNSAYVLSESTQAGYPTLTVTVPTDVAKQQDLLASQSGELAGNYRNNVDLSFKHILTAVKFVCGDDMAAGTVKSVTLKGVYSKGTYNMGTGSWTTSGSTTSFTQTLDKATEGTSGEAITTDAQTFMMIPQTLPTDATIEVKFTDSSNTEHTLTANVSGQAWPKGSTVTYKLSTSSINWTYTLNVTGLSTSFAYDGGTNVTYKVTSNRTSGSNTEPISWTTEFSTDNGGTWSATKPDWLTTFTTSGAGGTSTSYSATVSAQTANTDNDAHAKVLQNATVKGSASSPYNLSNQTNGGSTVENTANCYVVSAPGYYSFPLVYGNAIKNSNTNSSAYTSTKSGDNILQKFVNHLGNEITDPYISKNSSCTPKSAELVWQDAPNLVKDIKYNSGTNGNNISFHVDKSTIRQGNAVIAVKDASGNVLWSWHIWVTDEDLSKTIAVTNHSNETNYFMPVNLGWCDYGAVTYAARSCKVKFIAGSLSRELTINQSEFIFAANNPHYQWGRKDPFPPALSFYRNKPYYDNSGSVKTDDPSTGSNWGTGTNALKNYILYPGLMTGSSAGDGTYYNLWSADNTTYTLSKHGTKVVKTVYDPCPVGFTVPPGRAFTGFTTTGSGVSSSGSGINGTWSSSVDHYGYDFKVSSGTIFFGYLGYRDARGDYATYDASYWSAVPTVTNGITTNLGGYLSFGFSSLYQATGPYLWLEEGTFKGYGCSIRPTKEQ